MVDYLQNFKTQLYGPVARRISNVVQYWQERNWWTAEQQAQVLRVANANMFNPDLTYHYYGRHLFNKGGIQGYSELDVVNLLLTLGADRGTLFFRAAFKHNPDRYKAAAVIYAVLERTGRLLEGDKFRLLVGRHGLRNEMSVTLLNESNMHQTFLVNNEYEVLLEEPGFKGEGYATALDFIDNESGTLEYYYSEQNVLVRRKETSKSCIQSGSSMNIFKSMND